MLTPSQIPIVVHHSLSPAHNNDKQCPNPNLDSSSLKQLNAETDEQYDEALAKYEEVLAIQRDLTPGHPEKG
jgi:hypothetical protein